MHDATPDFFFFGASAALFLIPLKLRRFGITATRFAPRRSHRLSCASSARILFASTRIAAISSRDSFGTPSRTQIRWQRQPALPRRNQRINLMPLPMHLAIRCTARSKRSGKPCRSPAVGCHRVCRMHGAGGGAPQGNRNAWKHGGYSRESIVLRRHIADLGRAARQLIDDLE